MKMQSNDFDFKNELESSDLINFSKKLFVNLNIILGFF